MNIHKFVKEYEENEERLKKLAKEITYLQGIDNKAGIWGNFAHTTYMPQIIAKKIIFKFEHSLGHIELNDDDVDVLIEHRRKLQEPLFAKREEYEKRIKDI